MPPIRTALLCTCSLRAARPPGQLLLVLFEGSPSKCVRRGLMDGGRRGLPLNILTTNCGEKRFLIAFASTCGVNIPAVAAIKLPKEHHWTPNGRRDRPFCRLHAGRTCSGDPWRRLRSPGPDFASGSSHCVRRGCAESRAGTHVQHATPKPAALPLSKSLRTGDAVCPGVLAGDGPLDGSTSICLSIWCLVCLQSCSAQVGDGEARSWPLPYVCFRRRRRRYYYYCHYPHSNPVK